MRTRRRFSAEFKAKVALEAMGYLTVAELSTKAPSPSDTDPPGNARRSKSSPRCLTRRTPSERRPGTARFRLPTAQAKIGQLVVERDFLSKAFGRGAWILIGGRR